LSLTQAVPGNTRRCARGGCRQFRTDVCKPELAAQFGGLLWGNLMVSLLLGVAERPNSREVAARARDATAAFLQLHPRPINATMPRQHF